MPREEPLLGRSVEAREKGKKASLRRRCRYLLRGTLAVPGERRGGDGGGIEFPLARQSDGAQAERWVRWLTTRGLGSWAWKVGGDGGDLKLSEAKAGIELRATK